MPTVSSEQFKELNEKFEMIGNFTYGCPISLTELIQKVKQ